MSEAKGPGGRKRGHGATGAGGFKTLDDVAAVQYERVSTGMDEVDRVLGGGMVPGSYIVMGAAPGAGKSTLSTQILAALRDQGKRVGLIAGEESAAQIKMRYQRLGLSTDNIFISSNNNLDEVLADVLALGCDFLVVDSIQTVYTEDASGAEGSVSQVRECGNKLKTIAKDAGISTLLIGQVTKDGTLAGPRHLEHLVDVVLTIEGDDGTPWRILRANKNRFGTIDEIGVFEMTERGMIGVANPSELWMIERPKPEVGAIICPIMQGARPIMIEVQCLAVPSNYANPKRSAYGIDQKRVDNLIATLTKKCGLRLGEHDLYLSLSGGLKGSDPGLDLAICLAIASSYYNVPAREGMAAWGEVSLLGEIRRGVSDKRRRREAEHMGLENLVYNKDGKLFPLIEALRQAGINRPN
jgi:DNA repair protein RadA/Sms